MHVDRSSWHPTLQLNSSDVPNLIQKQILNVRMGLRPGTNPTELSSVSAQVTGSQDTHGGLGAIG
jgi:hypothetical protein